MHDTLSKVGKRWGGLLDRAIAKGEDFPDPVPTRFSGIDIAIENPKGSTRSGTNKSGKRWSVKMNHHYGFIKKANGADGEGLDVFLGPDQSPESVYVIHQNDPSTGQYDEDKVMLGFRSADGAKSAYLSNYNTPKFYRSTTIIPLRQFKEMLTTGKPGSVHWKRKHGRPLQANAMFSTDSELLNALGLIRRAKKLSRAIRFEGEGENADGHWVTMKNKDGAGTTHVFIDKGGNIQKGPAGLTGQNVEHIHKHPLYDIKKGALHGEQKSEESAGQEVSPEIEKNRPAARLSEQMDFGGNKTTPLTTKQQPMFSPEVLEQSQIGGPPQPPEPEPEDPDQMGMFPADEAQPQPGDREQEEGSGLSGEDALRQMTRNVPESLGGGVVPDPIAQEILRSPEGKEIAAMLPSGSKPIGAGAASVAFETPDGDVMRIGPQRDRPNIPEVLQPTERQDFGRYMVERLPKADTSNITEQDVSDIEQQLNASGYTMSDPGTDNLGRLPDGRVVVIDAGAVSPMEGANGSNDVAEQEGTGSEETPEMESPEAVPGEGAEEVPAQGQVEQPQMPTDQEIAQAANRGELSVDDLLPTHPHLAGDALIEQHKREAAAKAEEEALAAEQAEFGQGDEGTGELPDMEFGDEPEPQGQSAPTPTPQQPGQVNSAMSRAAIERTLQDYYDQTSGESEALIQDDQIKSNYADPFNFGKQEKGEASAIKENKDKGQRRKNVMSVGGGNGGGNASDAIGDLGSEKYEQFYNRQTDMKGKTAKSLDWAKKSNDPQIRLLAAIHEISGGRGRSTSKGVPANQLQVGQKDAIADVPVEVIDEDGEKVLHDGGEIPDTPLDALGDMKLPLDSARRAKSDKSAKAKPPSGPGATERASKMAEEIMKSGGKVPEPTGLPMGKRMPAESAAEVFPDVEMPAPEAKPLPTAEQAPAEPVTPAPVAEASPTEQPEVESVNPPLSEVAQPNVPQPAGAMPPPAMQPPAAETQPQEVAEDPAQVQTDVIGGLAALGLNSREAESLAQAAVEATGGTSTQEALMWALRNRDKVRTPIPLKPRPATAKAPQTPEAPAPAPTAPKPQAAPTKPAAPPAPAPARPRDTQRPAINDVVGKMIGDKGRRPLSQPRPAATFYNPKTDLYEPVGGPQPNPGTSRPSAKRAPQPPNIGAIRHGASLHQPGQQPGGASKLPQLPYQPPSLTIPRNLSGSSAIAANNPVRMPQGKPSRPGRMPSARPPRPVGRGAPAPAGKALADHIPAQRFPGGSRHRLFPQPGHLRGLKPKEGHKLSESEIKRAEGKKKELATYAAEHKSLARILSLVGLLK